jgi:hypothetical protein
MISGAILKRILGTTLTSGAIVLCVAGQASATSQDFNFNKTSGRQWLSTTDGKAEYDTAYLVDFTGASASFSFSDADNSGIGSGLLNVVANTHLTMGDNIVRDNITATFSVSFNDLQEGDNPDGVYGLGPMGVESSGTVSISDDSGLLITYEVMAKAKTFNGSEVEHMGSGNLFVFDSERYGAYVFDTWLQSTSAITMHQDLGPQAIWARGDIHGRSIGGTEVPEPGTMLLLGAGVLGGLRRKKGSLSS